MTSTPLSIPDVLRITPRVHGDARGAFLESWHAADFAAIGVTGPWVQDNVATSTQGVLRGMHCQVQQAQGKLVRCLYGRVFDVAVDLRAASPHFGKWCAVQLDDQAFEGMYIPPGFAHGYYVLSERATIMYKVTDYYAPAHERCLQWNDPAVGIEWPIIPGITKPIMTARDMTGASLAEARAWFP